MGNSVDAVVLVHGLWMHGLVFLPQRHALQQRGFAGRAFSYRSLQRGLDDNARALAAFIGEIDAPRIHLVGHSLGGLVACTTLAHYPDKRIRRAVLMGSPYGDCHAARMLLQTPGLATVVGRSMRDWLDQSPPVIAPEFEIGVLAGNRSLGLGRLIPGLPQPNDGVVALAETRIADARDSIVLPVAHSQMLVSAACNAQVAAFLKSGRFDHGLSGQDISTPRADTP
jgi:pimeloyl-ACP methyl ester carboxylesterase